MKWHMLILSTYECSFTEGKEKKKVKIRNKKE